MYLEQYDVNHKKQLYKAVSYFFFSAYVSSKLRQLPYAFFFPIFNVLSITLNMIGYSLWWLATYLHPDQSRSEFKWYGFAQFKEQHRISAILGIIASLFSFLAIAYPVLLIPAAWLFLSGNIVWTISEYHKLKNPASQEPGDSYEKQNNLLSYSGIMTAIGFITALSTTLSICFPALSIFVIIASSLIYTGLGVLAFEFWLNYNIAPEVDPLNNNSYLQMSESLSPQDSEFTMKNNVKPPYQSGNEFINSRQNVSINTIDETEEMEYDLRVKRRI